MLLYWYACISTNTNHFETHHISLKTDWWALSNASSIVWIRSAVYDILADKAFIATDSLISQSFVVAFVPSAYVWIVLTWAFQRILVCENWSTGCGDTSWMKFVTRTHKILAHKYFSLPIYSWIVNLTLCNKLLWKI